MASSVIGALRVNLGIDTATFNKGLKSAEGSLKKFGSGMRSLQGMFAGLAGAAGVGLLTKAFLDISKSADDMGKMAQKFGIPVEELSGLAYAAKMADVEIETLAKGLRTLSLTMAEAASDGKSKAAAAFTAVGISVRDAAGNMKTSSQVLSELAGKFSTYEDGVNKGALATEFFKKTGLDLIPLLNQGSAALDESAEKARKYGLIVSQETAVAADQFNDNLEDLGNIVRGVLMSAFAQLSGPLARISGEFLTAAEKSDLLTAAGKRLAEGTMVVVANLARQMASLRRLAAEVAAVAGIFEGLGRGNSNLKPGAIVQGFKELKQAGADYKAELESIDATASRMTLGPVGGGVDAAKEQVRQLNSAIKDTGAATDAAASSVDVWGDAVAGAASSGDDAADRIGSAFKLVGDEVVNLQQKTEGIAKPLVDAPVLIDPAQVAAESRAAKQAADEIARAQQALGEEMTALYEQTRTPAEAAAMEIERLNHLFTQGLDFGVYQRAVAQVNEGLQQTSEMAREVALTFEDAFMSAFDSLMEGTLSLKNAIGDLLKDLARLFMQQAATGLFGGGQGGGIFGGVIGSIFGGGGGAMAPAMPMGNIGGGGGGMGGELVIRTEPHPFFITTVDRRMDAKMRQAPAMMADKQARGLR